MHRFSICFLIYLNYKEEYEVSAFPICPSTHYCLASAPLTNQDWGRLVFKQSKPLGVFAEAVTLKLKFYCKKPINTELFIFHFSWLKYERIFYSAFFIQLINSCPVVLVTFTNQLFNYTSIFTLSINVLLFLFWL